MGDSSLRLVASDFNLTAYVMGKFETIRIAHIVGKMRAGGVESFLMNYYRHINRDVVQFDFIIGDDSSNYELIPEIERLGGRAFVVPSYLKTHAYMKELRLLFQEKSWRIVHSHINTLSVFPLYAAKQAGVSVRIAHSHSMMGKGEFIHNMAKASLRHFSNSFPTNRMACSREAGEWLFGKDAECQVVKNAIELEKFKFDEKVRRTLRYELGISEEAFVIGHIGRFMPQKNHEFLVEVFREIASVEANAVLVLAGEGPLKSQIESKAKEYGLIDRIYFLGQRSDPERLYQGFDVFVLPSLYEGLGMVAIEAQAAGLMCFISDVCPNEVKVTENVCFIPLADNAALWSQELLNARGNNNRQLPLDRLVEAGYDIEVAAKKLEQTYLRLYESSLSGVNQRCR